MYLFMDIDLPPRSIECWNSAMILSFNHLQYVDTDEVCGGDSVQVVA